MAITWPTLADVLPLVPHPTNPPPDLHQAVYKSPSTPSSCLLRSPYRSRLLPAPPILQASANWCWSEPSSSQYSCFPAGVMGRSLLPIFLLLPLLLSVGHAAPTFHDIWNLVLPHSASSEAAAVADHFPHGELRSRMPTTGEAGDQGAGDVSEHSKLRVDAGTKAWPFAYYNRRDREGSLDWGTKSWPYIYYSKREDKGDLAASSDAGAAVYYGRKAGHGLRL